MSDERIAVTIRLYGLGRKVRHAAGAPIARTYASGTTVGDALRDVGIAHEAEVSVLIGGRVVSAKRPLEPGDELLVIPPLVGGALVARGRLRMRAAGDGATTGCSSSRS